MATFVVDLPERYAGVKVGPSILLRNPEDELEVILICDGDPFHVVLTEELDGKQK